MLLCAWLFLGVICAVLQMAGFFTVLIHAGWHPGDPTGPAPPHHSYQQATTMTFLGVVSGQIGTAFAARTDHASLRSIGVFNQPPAPVGHRLLSPALPAPAGHRRPPPGHGRPGHPVPLRRSGTVGAAVLPQ
ncbi:cation transporting ATPase C-terminal domain-containing protein [Streptomyces sp. NPDC001272]